MASYNDTGITPTCVGNTSRLRALQYKSWDHPHLRGEYGLLQRMGKTLEGSPPLAWGILIDLTLEYAHQRITPTCVGNTCQLTTRKSNSWDHPHLRGEYTAC